MMLMLVCFVVSMSVKYKNPAGIGSCMQMFQLNASEHASSRLVSPQNVVFTNLFLFPSTITLSSIVVSRHGQ